MATPASYPKAFDIYRGDTFVKTLSFAQGTTFDVAGNPLTTTPIDLTLYGDEWSAQLRTSEDSDDAIPFTVDTSQLSAGKVTLRLESDITATLPAKGDWDIQVIDTTQNPPFVRTLARGMFTRTKDVTRA